jgi:hypothetical protein
MLGKQQLQLQLLLLLFLLLALPLAVVAAIASTVMSAAVLMLGLAWRCWVWFGVTWSRLLPLGHWYTLESFGVA